MQLLSALMLAVAASVASAAVASSRPSDLNKRFKFDPVQRWCNSGTPGDGGCEKMGKHTYCCDYQQTGPAFSILRTVTVTSKGPDGFTGCEGWGLVYCA
ncbi:hypothetical protein E4U22_001557 [Claviceps purpurea]|nr:hypothetical protein E4U12_000309 [Claviceps purpurea]KAG6136907.1 hypothetical protein E4U28_004774 [Claviceps purpurea]KAG6170420.1 hypothetical protein E4U51_000857 [Claviceps purpurea]KAG6234819.1 hypothetical protein E4U24_008525 [Claviceps purpurea]KAG6247149.1 hypothetical protein E4U23_004101 [Claviceps purpurea]